MKKFIIGLTVILLVIIICFKLFFDPIAKSFIEKNLSKNTGKIVVIESVETDLLKGLLQVRNLQLKNDKIFLRENLVALPLLEINFNISEIFSKNIHFKKLLIHNLVVNYDVIIKDGKLVDNFYLVEESVKQDSKYQNNLTKKNIQNNEIIKKDQNKGPQIDFIIDRLIIPKITISAYSKNLQFEKNIIIDQMIFENVGNTKESNHYKDVLAMIVTNVAVKINNEIVIKNLRKNFEKKLKEILGKNNIRSIIGNDPNKILNELEKLFK